MTRKARVEIPRAIAAKVLFNADRTCCKCREPGKGVQIHHIDEDPSNNDESNLAVLCFDCHGETMVRGGFARKLDADQVVLYRNDWSEIVATGRARLSANEAAGDAGDESRLELATSLAEIYRENEEWELLAMHFDSIGNFELRDKYIEIALDGDPTDSSIEHLRSLQDRPDLIPSEVIDRTLVRLTETEDWSQRARFFYSLHRYKEAASDYALSVHESLVEGRTFSAAFYLREMTERGLGEELYVAALQEAAEDGDLWWQVRSLQDLGWTKELHELVLEHATSIDESGDPTLVGILAAARGDSNRAIEARKAAARLTSISGDAVLSPVSIHPDDDPA